MICRSFKNILQLYEKALGQKINRNKTTVFFNKATIEGRKEEIKDFLGVNEVREYERYLGLPAVVGINKKASLNYIKERVWNKLQGWKEKLLSQVGREVLLKAMVQEQSLPLPWDVSLFLTPHWPCS